MGTMERKGPTGLTVSQTVSIKQQPEGPTVTMVLEGLEVMGM